MNSKRISTAYLNVRHKIMFVSGWTILIPSLALFLSSCLLHTGNGQNQQLNKELLSACYDMNSDMQNVQLLLDKGADVNAKLRDGDSALMIALYMYNIDILRLLIDRGADVNARDKNGKSVLIQAAEKGRTHAITILVDRGADINAKSSSGKTPLIMAAIGGYTHQYFVSQVVRCLFIAGPRSQNYRRQLVVGILNCFFCLSWTDNPLDSIHPPPVRVHGRYVLLSSTILSTVSSLSSISDSSRYFST
jgi:ankyrin repeat protein